MNYVYNNVLKEIWNEVFIVKGCIVEHFQIAGQSDVAKFVSWVQLLKMDIIEL